MAPGVGSGPGRRLASLSPQSASPAAGAVVTPIAGAVVTSVAPAGHGSTGVTDTDTGAAEDPHPATLSATANSTRVPVGLHASHAPAADTRSRNVSRVRSIPSRRLDSTAANCVADGPSACDFAAS